eukprot:1142650-Pelagomonas_calceolata.AAC.2
MFDAVWCLMERHEADCAQRLQIGRLTVLDSARCRRPGTPVFQLPEQDLLSFSLLDLSSFSVCRAPLSLDLR